MTALVWRSARGHAASLTGAFLALAIGAALLSALILTLASAAGGPAGTRWFTPPDVAVAGTDTVLRAIAAEACLVTAVLASVVPAAVIVRKRPAELSRTVE